MIRRGGCLIAAIAVCLTAVPLAAQVTGRIIRTGLFPGAGQMIRPGAWTFVEVELRYNGTAPLDAELRLDQRDRDGDIVTSATPAPLNPNGDPRRLFVYFMPHSLSSGDLITVTLVDHEGKPIKILDGAGQEQVHLQSEPIMVESPEVFVVADLTSPRKSAHAAWIDTARIGLPNESRHRRIVRGLTPAELPTRWQGLAGVDAIIWDDADPSTTTPQQLEMLVEWVKNGGRLLLTCGRTWQAIAKCPLAEILPVTLSGSTMTTQALEFQSLVGEEIATQLKLERRYLKNPITRCTMTPLPGAVPIPRECANPQIAHRGIVGRGQITFVGASLQQLLPPPTQLAAETDPDAVKFEKEAKEDPFIRTCRLLVAQNFLALPLERPPSEHVAFQRPSDLFNVSLRRTIDFGALSVGFLAISMLFAIIYGLGATFGSYWWLRRRGWAQHAWTAFACLAVIASIIGTFTVWGLRGFNTRLMQTSVIDMSAGIDAARGSCLLGVKSPKHTRLNLTLPVESTGTDRDAPPTLITPMPDIQSMDAISTSFVAPEEYRLTADGGRIEGVPLRATLKEFFGVWHGSVGGTVEGKLITHADPNDKVQLDLDDASYITNNLGVDLRDCYLLETRNDTPTQTSNIDPSGQVYCHELGSIAAGSRLDAATLRTMMFFEPPDPANPGAALKRKPSRFLPSFVKQWRNTVLPTLTEALSGTQTNAKLKPDQEHAAVLLLSVFNLIGDWNDAQNMTLAVTRSMGRSLDCSHELTSQTAVLLGYADQPAAATLEVDRTALQPTKSYTMYRIVIPVERR